MSDIVGPDGNPLQPPKPPKDPMDRTDPNSPEIKVVDIRSSGGVVLIIAQQGTETRETRIPPWEAEQRAEAVGMIAKKKKDSYEYRDEYLRDIRQANQLKEAARECYEFLVKKGVAVRTDPRTGKPTGFKT